MRLPKKWFGALIAVLVCFAGGMWLIQQNKIKNGMKTDRNRPVPVLTGPVRSGEAPVIITALGTVTARQQATVRARVDGLLLSVDYTEGAVVKSGETLARIDPRPFEAALAVAQGQLEKDQAQLEIARTDVGRYKKLLAEDSIASQQVDAQVALVKQLEGVVAADKGSVAAARLNLSFTAITAPITGKAGLRQIDPGNIVHASDSTGVVVLTEVQPINVVFSVPQENLPSILARYRDRKEKGELMAEMLDRDSKTPLENGKVLAIDNQTDVSTGSVKIKAQCANESNRLFPGQFVNVRLIVDTLKDAKLIPQSAVQRGTQGTYVYAVTADKTATVRPVQLGPSSGERVVVLDGLAEGETVVLDGADKLREGAPVTTVEAPPPGQQGKGGVAPPSTPNRTPETKAKSDAAVKP